MRSPVCKGALAILVALWLGPRAGAQESEPSAPPEIVAPTAPAAEHPSSSAPGSEAPSASGTSDDSAETMRAELEALRGRVEELESVRERAETALGEAEVNALTAVQPFRIYGFADFGLNHAWLKERSFLKGLAASDTTFTMGNLNLYFDFHPTPSWQMLAEIRFSAYPHGDEVALGTPAGGQYARVDTTVTDVTSPATGRQFRWGSIFIERAYAQWTYSEKLSVRVGQFLTPYGIWNVDHATTTLITLMVPHFVSSEVFPARQVGVEAYGAVFKGEWELGYDAYVSNGRTTTQIDLTEDKAFGGRLRAARYGSTPLLFGTSFYYGSFNDVEKNITSFDPFEVERRFTVAGKEWGVGVDASVDHGPFRLRAETLMRQMRFQSGKRAPITFGPPGSLRPDNNEFDGYLLGAYRLPFWNLEPFVYGEYDHYVSPFGDDQLVLSSGFNVHFTPYTQLKNQFARVVFFDWNDAGSFSDNNMWMLFSRVAIAF